jgi:hypothetical protein
LKSIKKLDFEFRQYKFQKENEVLNMSQKSDDILSSENKTMIFNQKITFLDKEWSCQYKKFNTLKLLYMTYGDYKIEFSFDDKIKKVLNGNLKKKNNKLENYLVLLIPTTNYDKNFDNNVCFEEIKDEEINEKENDIFEICKELNISKDVINKIKDEKLTFEGLKTLDQNILFKFFVKLD